MASKKDGGAKKIPKSFKCVFIPAEDRFFHEPHFIFCSACARIHLINVTTIILVRHSQPVEEKDIPIESEEKLIQAMTDYARSWYMKADKARKSAESKEDREKQRQALRDQIAKMVARCERLWDLFSLPLNVCWLPDEFRPRSLDFFASRPAAHAHMRVRGIGITRRFGRFRARRIRTCATFS
jgi:hypothetical protein